MSTTPFEHTYKEMERLIQKIAWDAVRQFGIDYHEALSAANWGFVQAFRSYVPDIGAFTTWVGFKAKKRIEDLIRDRATARRFEPVELDTVAQPKPSPKFDVDDYLDRLSEDARIAAELVLRAPMDVKATLAKLGSQSPADWRLAVREFLRDVGWAHERMMKAFTEIKETR